MEMRKSEPPVSAFLENFRSLSGKGLRKPPDATVAQRCSQSRQSWSQKSIATIFKPDNPPYSSSTDSDCTPTSDHQSSKGFHRVVDINPSCIKGFRSLEQKLAVYLYDPCQWSVSTSMMLQMFCQQKHQSAQCSLCTYKGRHLESKSSNRQCVATVWPFRNRNFIIDNKIHQLTCIIKY